MKIMEFFECENKNYWLNKISESDWKTGKYLFELLKSNQFFSKFGINAKVFMLVDNNHLLAFCRLSPKKYDIHSELSPWLGCVYTFPEYRARACALCRKNWIRKTSTPLPLNLTKIPKKSRKSIKSPKKGEPYAGSPFFRGSMEGLSIGYFLCKKKVLAILGAVWYNLPYDWKRLRFFMKNRIGKKKSAYNFRNRRGAGRRGKRC